jgi:16S rRNA G527 N7-methylase RsmG
VVIWNKNKTIYLFDLRPKKIIFFKNIYSNLHLQCKYGVPKQAKHERINVFRPVSEQNFIPE